MWKLNNKFYPIFYLVKYSPIKTFLKNKILQKNTISLKKPRIHLKDLWRDLSICHKIEILYNKNVFW